jgi:hypothetical protein
VPTLSWLVFSVVNENLASSLALISILNNVIFCSQAHTLFTPIHIILKSTTEDLSFAFKSFRMSKSKMRKIFDSYAKRVGVTQSSNITFTVDGEKLCPDATADSLYLSKRATIIASYSMIPQLSDLCGSHCLH